MVQTGGVWRQVLEGMITRKWEFGKGTNLAWSWMRLATLRDAFETKTRNAERVLQYG